jgi:hypothetical protein
LQPLLHRPPQSRSAQQTYSGRCRRELELAPPSDPFNSRSSAFLRRLEQCRPWGLFPARIFRLRRRSAYRQCLHLSARLTRPGWRWSRTTTSRRRAWPCRLE